MAKMVKKNPAAIKKKKKNTTHFEGKNEADIGG